MTPTEKLVMRVIQDEREAQGGTRAETRAIMPRVLARTGVCGETYWRALAAVNREEGVLLAIDAQFC